MSAKTQERAGERWVIALRYERPFEMVSRFRAEAMGFAIEGERVADEAWDTPKFLVCDGHNLSEVKATFDTLEDAQACMAEANRFDVQGPLDPEFTHRRERLAKLDSTRRFWHTGPECARIPVRPARYAVHHWLDDDHGWTNTDDRDEIKGYVEAGEVGQIIDLDTGEEVPFEREVTVGIAWPTDDTQGGES